ncbi:acetyl-coenzyme A synthetase, cytoplasmic-like [Limulus polyphemus]|uniref:Acetyl-coenzyme A synthetase n=1 Tax=Limulus polyphemus TaxID=6850 RepID=A0ABM1BBR2_LIMPO|nr:acetyl-coenzyme A synthetase, cytoplasmic-like [Limulus polyphemus]
MASKRGDVSNELYLPNKIIQENAFVKTMDEYRKLYKRSVESPEIFWKEIADEFYWKTEKKGKFFSYNFDISKGPVYVEWMKGSSTNTCYNLLDRNVIEKGFGDRIAYYWEGNDPDDHATITYKELLRNVCKFANVLKGKGVKKEDCVAIYLPMIMEVVVAMLACSRIGAIHSVIFGGFSAQSLAQRILDAKCTVLITADGVWRGTKLLNLKETVDEAYKICKENGHHMKASIVVKHLGPPESKEDHLKKITQQAKRPVYDLKTPWNPDIDCWWHEEMNRANDICEPEWVDAENPLFILYTSGSTGKPKGVVHTTGGYLLYAATTFKYVFDYHPGDIYFCTADVGWITGHTYVVYGPLAQGATSVMFEGLPFHPHPGRYWEIIDKYRVTKFYTAPTAVRALMKYGDSHVTKYDRSSLKILGSVGEPINPEAWLWYHKIVGNEQCSIVDTFWQTETGGHVLTPLPGCTPTKPGSATFPFFGVVPALLNDEGKEIQGPGEGYLVFKKPWPGMMRTIYKSHERFETTYFEKFIGYYCTGDGARRDEDGYYWVTGRVDDMLNVSGHLLSTAQVESALIEHKAVSETAVVSHPHSVKGECLYAFIVLKEGYQFNSDVEKELRAKVRSKIGPFASPEFLHHTSGLPKTRSGKIMRRILRKIARNDRDLGDLSTLADPQVVDELYKTRPKNI